jgi:hypothetical protein
MRSRRSIKVGWGTALCAAILGGCSPASNQPAVDARTAAQRGAALAVTDGIPADFPRMLGCAAEELGNPTDPAVADELKRICDVLQTGLYALSQDPTLDDQARMHHALMLMGGGLERMTQVLLAADASPTDAGVQP